MKGTEKQIAWATELTEKMEREFAAYLQMVPENQKQKGKKVMDEILSLTKEAYAGDVIELLSGNNQESFKYYKRFFTDMKISGNALAMQIKKEVFNK